jgi:hypothetical protein
VIHYEPFLPAGLCNREGHIDGTAVRIRAAHDRKPRIKIQTSHGHYTITRRKNTFTFPTNQVFGAERESAAGCPQQVLWLCGGDDEIEAGHHQAEQILLNLPYLQKYYIVHIFRRYFICCHPDLVNVIAGYNSEANGKTICIDTKAANQLLRSRRSGMRPCKQQ